MRRPTTESDAYRWWRRTLAGERVPRIEDEPEPGFYKIRRVKGGPFVPVAIWIEQDLDDKTGELIAPEELRCIVNGVPADPVRTWLFCRAITSAEYDALTGAHGRIEEMAATHACLDLGAMAPITP